MTLPARALAALRATARATLTPPDLRQLSPHGHLRLLDMAFRGLRYSVTTIPVVSLPLVLYDAIADGAPWTALWSGFYVLLALAVWGQWRRYRADAARQPPEAVLVRWQPLLQTAALLHGLVLGCAAVLASGRMSFAFLVMLHVALVGVTAASVSHQAPVVGVFLRFLFASWSLILLRMPVSFPDLWPYFMALSVLFVLGLYRHAMLAHRFIVEQVRLEERGQELAEQFRAAKEAAEQALQEKNRFLATASHDLRQPVHAMGMLVAALQARQRDAALAPLFSDLRSSMASLNLMFNSLLDLSRLESGRVQVQPAPVALAPLLHEVAALYREQAQRQGLALRVRLPRGACVAMGDTALVRQALVNLTHNALRYTVRGGVLLAVRRRGDHWSIEVWDSGVGVATEDHSRVFSPYFRSERAWQIDDAGHGLGLAAVARGAALLGVDYGMRSQLGQGSCFWLRLRAADVPSPLVAADTQAARLTPVAVGLCGDCLVIDDDPQVLTAWQTLLSGWGLQVRGEMSGAAAMAAVEAGFAPHAIFCDQRLRSGESGFEVLQALLARCPDASGAMVSGEFDSTALQEAEAEGYLVLRKPLDPDTLREVLSRWLAGAAPLDP